MLLLVLFACTGDGFKSGGDDSADGPTCDTAGSDLPPACSCDDPAVEVGGGQDTFESVAEGSSATMVHGPQGGWHVLGSARMSYMDDIVSIHYTITVEPEGVTVSDNTYRVQMVKDEECSGYYPAMYGYLDVTPLVDGDLDTPPELLADKDLRLRMEVTDLASRTATDELNVIAALDPVDAAVGDTGVDTGP